MAGLEQPVDSRFDSRDAEAQVTTRLARLWCSELGFDSVDPQDDFYDLGGNSLLAISLSDRIAAEFHVEFSSYDIARWPTIAEQSAEITRTLVALIVQDGHPVTDAISRG